MSSSSSTLVGVTGLPITTGFTRRRAISDSPATHLSSREGSVKLILSIINRDDSNTLIDALMRHGYRATVISTTGGFLREGNATILIGAEDEKVQEVLQLIREGCHTRTQFVNPLPPVMEPGELYMPTPVEVQVGGATVFVINVETFHRF
jgi:uncharacterized protein YaaQ